MRKFIIFLAIFIYWISPVDFVPGVLVDDIIITVLGFALSKKGD